MGSLQMIICHGNASIRKRYQGPAFGRDLYRILSTSRITVNCHIDVAGQFADNMRLFEATGAGTLLITDWKVNLHNVFELGKEVGRLSHFGRFA